MLRSALIAVRLLTRHQRRLSLPSLQYEAPAYTVCSAIGVECGGYGGYAYPSLFGVGVQYPPLFIHAWHNFGNFLRRMVHFQPFPTIFVSEYGWKCTVRHRKFQKCSQTCGTVFCTSLHFSDESTRPCAVHGPRCSTVGFGVGWLASSGVLITTPAAALVNVGCVQHSVNLTACLGVTRFVPIPLICHCDFDCGGRRR